MDQSGSIPMELHKNGVEPKRKVGRPKKINPLQLQEATNTTLSSRFQSNNTPTDNETTPSSNVFSMGANKENEQPQPAKKKRGRPKKDSTAHPNDSMGIPRNPCPDSNHENDENAPPKKKRGRPRKDTSSSQSESTQTGQVARTALGNLTNCVSLNENQDNVVLKRKVGRPKKNTMISQTGVTPTNHPTTTPLSYVSTSLSIPDVQQIDFTKRKVGRPKKDAGSTPIVMTPPVQASTTPLSNITNSGSTQVNHDNLFRKRKAGRPRKDSCNYQRTDEMTVEWNDRLTNTPLSNVTVCNTLTPENVSQQLRRRPQSQSSLRTSVNDITRNLDNEFVKNIGESSGTATQAEMSEDNRKRKGGPYIDKENTNPLRDNPVNEAPNPLNSAKKSKTTHQRANLMFEVHPEAYNNRYASESETDDDNEDNDYDSPENPLFPELDEPIMQIGTKRSSVCIKIGVQKNGYYECGDAIYTCSFCGAYMWYDERIGKRKKSPDPVFTMCCKKGKVVLPKLKHPPRELIELLCGVDAKSKNFRALIRLYNMMFSFTSLGGRIDHSVNNGRGPFVYKMNGENYHCIGDILPTDGEIPKFLQLYIFDTINEVSNRIKAAGGKKVSGEKINEEIVAILKNMLDTHNPHVKGFRTARDRYDKEGQTGLRLRLVSSRTTDARTHNLPTADEVAILIPDDFQVNMATRDIILETNTGKLQRISELHPAYLPLQYPLLFPYGEDGFRLQIPIGLDTTGKKRNSITMREFLAYRIIEREGESPIICRSGKLFQQLSVDGYTMLESSRLRFVRRNQKKLRSANYEAIQKAAEAGGADLSKQGQRIFIPASFTGGPRYMNQHYLDAMAICKYFGFPDLFITFTCNPKWPEITRYLDDRGLLPEDRPDIMCRVFKMKLDHLIETVTKKKDPVFGNVQAAMYTIEFQKRGLPHAHILLFMEKGSKIQTTDDIDKYICAEIPDRTTDPDLYQVVSDSMMHGPCGLLKWDSVCMVDGKCSKNFPKPFNNETSFDKNGFPAYRRRDNQRTVNKNGIELDNRYVVPYNKELMRRYKAHINVEWCVQSRAVKYLFKYIHKGPDYVDATIENEEDGVVDEIKRYYNCRYVAAPEAIWRLLAFRTHFRTLSVEKLGFHLPNEHMCFFDENEPVESVLKRFTMKETMFLAWMAACKKYPELAGDLTYAEFPTKFVWKAKTREWKPRTRGFAIGRIAHVHPAAEEYYYLRVLLNYVRGPTSYEDIRTWEGILYKTFYETCEARGLLSDDKEYIIAIKDASDWSLGKFLRRFFAVMLMSELLSLPHVVWEATWEYLVEDILYQKRLDTHNPDLTLSDDQLKNIALTEIENILLAAGKTLSKWDTMPLPEEFENYVGNRLIDAELNYDLSKQKAEHERLLGMITDEQRGVYEEILDAVLNDRGGVFFLSGFGGTGKTFIWSILSAALRSRGLIVINTASSGIASLLLPGGRTAHSRFGIKLNPDEFTSCKMTPGSDVAELMIAANLIVWDEAPMMSKHCFENLDRALRDIIRDKEEIPFGGKVVVFGGDFRQILPIINGGGRSQTVMAALNSSEIWKQCKVLKLTKNMRLLSNANKENVEELKEFSEWLLKIGEGKINEPNDGIVDIEFPEDMLIKDDVGNPIQTIVDAIYGKSFGVTKDKKFYPERAILAPTNDDVDEINNHMLKMFPGEEKVYISSDSIITEDVDPNDNVVYPIEFLNNVKLGGFPKHELKLKIGVPVMCLRNIDPNAGLCNGTRLIITQMTRYAIEARIITGADDKIGNLVLIPRTFLSPSETKYPFRMRRRQFPLTLAFAMTINKSQGQSLEHVGLYLPKPVFSHGQLYVALSRAKSRKGVKILITDKDKKVQTKTTNVVYKEIFNNVR